MNRELLLQPLIVQKNWQRPGVANLAPTIDTLFRAEVERQEQPPKAATDLEMVPLQGKSSFCTHWC